MTQSDRVLKMYHTMLSFAGLGTRTPFSIHVDHFTVPLLFALYFADVSTFDTASASNSFSPRLPIWALL
jgi:hypothetical protein